MHGEETRVLAFNDSSLCDPNPTAERANTLFAETTTFLIQFEKGLSVYHTFYACTNCRDLFDVVPQAEIKLLQVAEPNKDFGR